MNKYREHVYVIPEDDANRQIADGFINHHAVNNQRIQVLPPPGGWGHVLKTFEDEYLQALQNYSLGHVVMLIDFDEDFDSRWALFERAIPDQLKARVFVIGSKITPESLRTSLGLNFEAIGAFLANDCENNTTTYWGHEHLRHNLPELQRLLQMVKPILF